MRLVELVGTISLAADAGTGSPEDFGLRAGTLAARVAQALGAPDAASDAMYLALLRYSGCTAEGHLASHVMGDEVALGAENFGTDWGNPREMLPVLMRHARKGKGTLGGIAAMARTLSRMAAMMEVPKAHCEVAMLIAGRLGFDETFRAALGQHGERWNGKGAPNKLKGDAIARAMRIAHVAQELEIGHRVGGVEGAVARAKRLAGTALDPAIVDAVAGDAARICASVEGLSAWQALLDAEPAPHREIADAQLDDALAVLADFADLKCRFTRGHSAAVADLAARAAKQAGLPEAVVRDVRRAGLLHDLGRVAIAAGIWDKPTPLTDIEREKIRMHTYVGERVLARSPELSRLADIACLAHERLDASGYHRRLSANACPPAARILAVADVYCALVEDRPHRKAMSRDAAEAELRKTTGLCPDATQAVLAAAGHAVAKPDKAGPLTERELEVLKLLAKGLTNKEIAGALDISRKTAGHHVQHIFEKLGVTTRAGATMCAMQRGLA